MEIKPEETTPHNPVVKATPEVGSEVIIPNAETKIVSQKEYDDLTKRATVSSQNFERVKKLEAEKAELESQLDLKDNVVLSEIDDETITKLRSDISSIQGELDRTKVIEKYPVLKEIWSEVEKFRKDPENRGMSIQTAAKAFIIENNLSDTPRLGLEKTTGGSKVPVSTGMTSEEVAKLRTNDYEKYRLMLKNGQIKMS